METLEEILSQYDMEEYKADFRKVAELIKSGVPIKFTKYDSGSIKTIHTEKKRARTEKPARPEPTAPVIEPIADRLPIESVPAPIYKEELPLINMEVEAKELLSFMGEAQLYAQFCEAVLDKLETPESRIETWKQIAEEYNSGNLIPELYQMKGNRTERSLRKWIDLYLENKQDMFALIHKAKREMRGRKVTFLEQSFLKKILLSPQKVKIYTAVKTLKSYARMGALESPSSLPTLVRWCQDYEKNNKAIWTQARLGSKAVAEDIVKTIYRDNSMLSVGDVWVADGHTLAFDIVNPKTGKAQRMTMIMVMDWASRYPVGAALAYTEDSQHIQMAFRNAFLNWGAVPKYVYLDNGMLSPKCWCKFQLIVSQVI